MTTTRNEQPLPYAMMQMFVEMEIKGLAMSELSMMAGMAPNTLREWRAKSRGASLTKFQQVADALDMDVILVPKNVSQKIVTASASLNRINKLAKAASQRAFEVERMLAPVEASLRNITAEDTKQSKIEF